MQEARKARNAEGADEMDIIGDNAGIVIATAIVLGFAIGVFRVVSGR